MRKRPIDQKKRQNLTICYAGGGTAGHIFPSFVVQTQLQKYCKKENIPYSSFWIGTRSSREKSWTTEAQIPHYSIYTGKLRRYFSVRNFCDLWLILLGTLQSFFILLRKRPDVVFSKGGYASVPVVWASYLLRIPVVSHESDTTAGLATKLNAPCSHCIAVSCEETQSSLNPKYRNKVVFTGLPVRFTQKEVTKGAFRKALHIDEQVPLIVVIGGSLGATHINQLILSQLPALTSLGFVYHQIGENKGQPLASERYCAVPFIGKEYANVLCDATLVISRSGATALAEFIEMMVPMILIPLGTAASRGDQLINARRLANYNVAKVLDDPNICGDDVVHAVTELIEHEEERISMQERMKTLRKEHAAQHIALLLLQAARKRVCIEGENI